MPFALWESAWCCYGHSVHLHLLCIQTSLFECAHEVHPTGVGGASVGWALCFTPDILVMPPPPPPDLLPFLETANNQRMHSQSTILCRHVQTCADMCRPVQSCRRVPKKGKKHTVTVLCVRSATTWGGGNEARNLPQFKAILPHFLSDNSIQKIHFSPEENSFPPFAVTRHTVRVCVLICIACHLCGRTLFCFCVPRMPSTSGDHMHFSDHRRTGGER